MATKSTSKSTSKSKTKKTATTESKKTTAKTTAKKAASAKSKPAAEKKPRSTTKKAKSNGNGSDKRSVLIEQTAYFIAEQRGFEGGDPVQDWLAAERQVDEMLKENRT